MPEENLNQPINQAPEQANPSYKETLLLYNEQNGAVEAVSELKQEGRQYKAITGLLRVVPRPLVRSPRLSNRHRPRE